MTFGELVNLVGFKVNQSDVNNVNNTIKSISSTARKLLGVIGIGFSLTQLNAIAEEFDGIGDRLYYAAGEAENFGEIQDKVLASANNCRTAYGTIVNEVTKLKQANAEVFPIEDAAVFVEYVNKLGKAAGQSDGEISAMQSSIQRVVATGKMQAADLNRMMRQTPALAEQLAKGLGTDTEGLRRMAEQGQITAETLKTAMMNSTEDIDKAFGNLNFGISDAMLLIRNRFGVWVDDTNKMFNITQSMAKFLYSMFDRVLAGLTKIRNGVMWLAEKMGGVQHLMRFLAIAAGLLFTALKGRQIIDFLSKVMQLVGSIRGSTLLLLGAVLLVALLIEDFINFMQGNDSVIGEAFKAAGIDADEMRQKIVDTWENIKTFFSGIWEDIKQIFAPAIGWIKKKIEEVFGEDMFAGLGNGLAGIIEFFDRLSQKLAENKPLQEFIAKLIVGFVGLIAVIRILTPILAVVKALFAVLPGILSFLISPIGLIIAAIVALIAIGVLLYKHWDEIRQWAIQIWENIKSGISEKVTKIKDSIMQGVDGAVDYLRGLPEKALQWGRDLIQNMIDGIKEKAAKIGEAVSGVAADIKSFLGFSEPEEGPLSDFHTYMPDMIDMMVNGINTGRELVAKAANALAGDVAVGVNALLGSAPQPRTVNSVATSNNVSKSIVQNNNWTNTFNGDRAIQQQAAATMKRSGGDATAELARAMAYSI